MIPSADQVIDKAIEMRARQRMYFKTRAGVDLTESKRLEKEFDSLAASYQAASDDAIPPAQQRLEL